MTWNYRVIRRYLGSTITPDEREWVGIYEVYYDEHGSIVNYTREPIDLTADNLEELKSDMTRLMAAFDQPMLEYGKITKEEIDGRSNDEEGC